MYPRGGACTVTVAYLTYGFAARKDIPKVVSDGEINTEKDNKKMPLRPINTYLQYLPHFTTQPQRAAYTINLRCLGEKHDLALTTCRSNVEKCRFSRATGTVYTKH